MDSECSNESFTTSNSNNNHIIYNKSYMVIFCDELLSSELTNILNDNNNTNNNNIKYFTHKLSLPISELSNDYQSNDYQSNDYQSNTKYIIFDDVIESIQCQLYSKNQKIKDLYLIVQKIIHNNYDEISLPILTSFDKDNSSNDIAQLWINDKKLDNYVDNITSTYISNINGDDNVLLYKTYILSDLSSDKSSD